MKKKRVTRAAQHRAVVRRHRHLYDDLLAFQGGGCAVCGKRPDGRRLCMDHDHVTMKLRGILCPYHNRLLTTRFTPELLEALLEYVKSPPFSRFLESQ